MKKGIAFTTGTTDFDEAVRLCETTFHIDVPEDWEAMKKTGDFEALSTLLKTMDVDNYTFTLKDSETEEENT